MSAGANYYATQNIELIFAMKSLPILEIEPTTFRLGVRNGYQNTIGVQYQFTNSIRVDVNDMYYSGYTHIRSYHHLRIGFNTGFAF